MSKVKLENPNPTKAEKCMFRYCGWYLIEKSEELVRYATVHMDKIPDDFPEVLEMEPEYIDYKEDIRFELMSETIVFQNLRCDMDMLRCIRDRAEELFGKSVKIQ